MKKAILSVLIACVVGVVALAEDGRKNPPALGLGKKSLPAFPLKKIADDLVGQTVQIEGLPWTFFQNGAEYTRVNEVLEITPQVVHNGTDRMSVHLSVKVTLFSHHC